MSSNVEAETCTEVPDEFDGTVTNEEALEEGKRFTSSATAPRRARMAATLTADRARRSVSREPGVAAHVAEYPCGNVTEGRPPHAARGGEVTWGPARGGVPPTAAPQAGQKLLPAGTGFPQDEQKRAFTEAGRTSVPISSTASSQSGRPKPFSGQGTLTW
jgi:hypothetical protein